MIRISKSFLKSSLIYALAGALPMASALILLPFYTSDLTTAQYGAFSIYLAFSLFAQILTIYSFDTSVYVHFHEYRKDFSKLSSFVSSAFVLMLFIGVGVGLVFMMVGEIIFATVFADQSISFYPYGLLAVGSGVFHAFFKVHSNLLQSREKPQIFFWSNIVCFSLIASLTIAGLKLYPNTLAGPVGGRLVAMMVVGLWALGRIFKEFGIHFNFSLLRHSFSFNFYSFIYQLLQWVINHFDRVLLLFLLPVTGSSDSMSDVGVYDFAIKCLVIIELAMNGLHSSFFPKVLKTMMPQQDKHLTPEINRYFYGFTSAVMLLICISILVFPFLIDWFVVKPGYKLAIQYIPFIACIYVFRAMRFFFALPYSALKYMKPYPFIYLIVAAIKIILMIILVPEIRLYGVIASSLISSVMEILLIGFFMRNKFNYQFNKMKMVVAPFVLILVIIVIELLWGSAFSLSIHLFNLLFCTLLLWWVYRNEIKYINPAKLIQ